MTAIIDYDAGNLRSCLLYTSFQWNLILKSTSMELWSRRIRLSLIHICSYEIKLFRGGELRRF